MRQSFSLIEISATIVILTLMASGIFFLIVQGSFVANRAAEEITAYNLAEDVIEQYSYWPVLVNLTGSDPPTNGNYSNPPYSVPLNNVTYNLELVVSDGPCAVNQSNCPPNADLKQIEATVSWPKSKNITLSSLVAR